MRAPNIRVYKSTEYKLLTFDRFSFYVFDADVKEEPGSYRLHYSKTLHKGSVRITGFF